MDRRAVFRDLDRLAPPLVEAMRESMSEAERSLPVDLAFDAVGHALYARMRSLPGFGMARAESELIRTCGRDILRRAGNPCEIVDLYAGDATAVRPLLDRVDRYVAIERCRPMLEDTILGLQAAFPRLDATGIVGEPTHGLGALPRTVNPRLLLMLGGTLARLAPTAARLELSRVRCAMTPEDRLLVGMDLAKDANRLRAAYDDAGGVVAAFARNALRRANREVGTDFRLSEWDHVVDVLPDRGRVETRFVSRSDQWVEGGGTGEAWSFAAGESLVVERSHKPTEGQFAALALGAGFRIVETWTDEAQAFSTLLLASATDWYVA